MSREQTRAAMVFDDGNCFACGPENPIGLHLHFERSDVDEVFAWTVLAPEFQGWRNIAHGGIGMALLDEAMAHAAGTVGVRGVTAALDVRFRKPIPIGVPVAVEGRVLWRKRNVLGLSACVRDEDGTLLLEAAGKFVSMGRLDAIEDRRNPGTSA